MKKAQSKFLLILAIVSLAIIFMVVLMGTIQGRYTFWLKKDQGSLVLGIYNKLPQRQQIENILEGAYEATKEEFGEKLKETDVKVKSAMEREISNFTSSQIEALKLKICQDWGVVNQASPTAAQ